MPRAPSVRAPPDSARLAQIRSVRQSLSIASLKGWFRSNSLYFLSTEVSLLFCFAFYAADANNAQLSYAALRTPLARALYVVLFDLKPLIEDGNLQVNMYFVHARKRAPEHTSEYVKSQNFLGACPQTPLTQSVWGPKFCICPGPPQSSRRPCP